LPHECPQVYGRPLGRRTKTGVTRTRPPATQTSGRAARTPRRRGRVRIVIEFGKMLRWSGDASLLEGWTGGESSAGGDRDGRSGIGGGRQASPGPVPEWDGRGDGGRGAPGEVRRLEG